MSHGKNSIICSCPPYHGACSSSKQATTDNKPVLLDEDTFLLTEVSSDPTYGITSENPIQVGGGPKNEWRYLNALAGPNGEQITAERQGSCCPTKSPNALIGNMIMLDRYSVSWKGGNDPVVLYINMYDEGKLMAPKGFSIKKD